MAASPTRRDSASVECPACHTASPAVGGRRPARHARWRSDDAGGCAASTSAARSRLAFGEDGGEQIGGNVAAREDQAGAFAVWAQLAGERGGGGDGPGWLDDELHAQQQVAHSLL